MSITLSIPPPAIVQEVREWAEANGTSLNGFVTKMSDKLSSEDTCRKLVPGNWAGELNQG